MTWDRDKPLVEKGWVTQQQGTIDVQTLQAQQEAAVAVAQANVEAQEAQLKVLHQQKDYQSVVAPFDGVITQRNIDVGSLVQADATSGTFMFTIMHSDVIRTQVYVPQDAAFGVQPGVEAVMRVPEMPGPHLPGTVTRIANALQPGIAHAADRDRHPQSRRCAPCRGLLHRRAAHSPGDAQPSHFPGGGDHLQRRRPAGGRRRERRRAAHAHRHGPRPRPPGRGAEGVKHGDQVILNPSVDLVDGMRVQVRATASGS